MKELIARFYDSVRSGGEPPIPYREILPDSPNHGRHLCPGISGSVL